MWVIPIMHLEDKDLNLLVLFESVFQNRSTTEAGKKLNLSQPAVSHGLARLRDQMGDDLFVRSRKGLAPTPRALQLAPEVAKLLESAQKVFSKEDFSIVDLKAQFRIASTDFFEHIFLPKAFAFLCELAPQVILNMRPVGGSLPKRELEDGELDLAVAGFFGDLPESFHEDLIGIEPYVCLTRKGHPAIKRGKMNLQSFTSYRHVLVSPQGDLYGPVDEELQKMGQKRRVAVGVSSFQTPAKLIEKTDLITALPKSLAESFCENHDLEITEPPLKIPPIHLKLVWHARTHRSAPHIWLRSVLRENVTLTKPLK
jgi:DNA-binding transcriptional LysR family regulator